MGVKQNGRKKIGHKKEAVLRRSVKWEHGDVWMCTYCKFGFPKEALTVDHIVPQSRGGSDQLENLCIACRLCNGAKGDMTAEEYIAILEKARETEAGRSAATDKE